MYISEFGLKARVEMLRRGMTITELAEKLGVSPSYVSDILRGVREGKPQRKRIAEILELEHSEEME